MMFTFKKLGYFIWIMRNALWSQQAII